MSELTVMNVTVQLDPGLEFTPQIRSLVTEYIQKRFSAPVLAWNENAAGKPAMRLASPREAERLVNGKDCLTVRVGDFAGRICTLYGLTPDQLTEEDIAFAKKLWFEPVFVDLSSDGQPYIDD